MSEAAIVETCKYTDLSNTSGAQLDGDFDKQNKCPASANMCRSGGAALMAEAEFNFLYPLFNAGSHILPVRLLLN